MTNTPTNLFDRAKQIANAVLYEGYILYPYRASSVKNRQRWTFGGIYPRAYSEQQEGNDRWNQQLQCLVIGGPETTLGVQVRFLHLVAREVGALDSPWSTPDGDLNFHRVESLCVGDKTFYRWQEAVEREVDCANFALSDLLGQPKQIEFAFDASSELEPLRDERGVPQGVLERTQYPLQGAVEMQAEQIGASVYRLTVRVLNCVPFETENATRDDALMRSLISAHAILHVEGGEFVSLLDPPEPLRQAAAFCENLGTYPVLVGEPGARDMLLASPIILYDYPQIAPESAGDLFDGTEIDEILSLRILTLTDQEKQELCETDVRGGELLKRTEALSPEILARLHGTLRDATSSGKADGFSNESVRPTTVGKNLSGLEWELPQWNDLSGADLEPDRVLLESINVGGMQVAKGNTVRLCPKGRADAFDILLKGRIATVESIQQDFEERIYLAVTIQDDPGQEFGSARFPGHRFFYTPEEVEPL